ncbi:small subunit processome component 20 homolog [Argopecten irradians]|uniref:small subunit processome component 20 homolog n=1 Tax=Argopecten irradians TaxID=31199 RepID=UPI003715ECFE
MGKSSYHRSENTFRFQTFSERISDINIDVIHKIRHHDDTPGEQSTYFGEALEKWLELNCTAHFIDFRQEISDQVQSFTQLVHNETQIVAALKKHLMVQNTLAYEPLLDLLVQLARDLQHDFYKHFPDFFSLLVELLNRNIQDTDLMEKLFSALSYIFKFLWRYLLKDMEVVYGYFSNLLSEDNKQYIRQFAAESFAFLMRKVKDHGKLFDFLFKSLSESPENVDGLGRLMFEMLKGVKRQLHSCAGKIFPILLSKLGHCQHVKKVKVLPWRLAEECMSQCFRSMAENIDKDHFEDAWRILLTSITSVYQFWLDPNCPDKAKAAKHLARLLRLTQIWLNHANGVIIRSHDSIAMTLLPILKGACLPVSVGEELVTTVSTFLLQGHSRTAIARTAKLVSSVYKTSYQTEMLFKFTTTMLKSKLPIFEKDVLMSLNEFCLGVLEDEVSRDQVLSLYTQILLHKTTLPSNKQDLSNLQVYPLDFGLSGRPKFLELLTKTINAADNKTLKAEKHRSPIWSAVVCLPHVWPTDHARSERITCLTKLMGNIVAHIENSDDEGSTDESLFLYYSIMVALTYLYEDGDLCEKLPVSQITELLRCHSTNIHMLTAANLYLMQASVAGISSVLEEEILLEVFPCLQDNLTSWNSHIRTMSLQILTHFTVRLPSIEGFEADRDSVFQTCLNAELVPLSVQDYRQRLLYLQRLDYSNVQNALPQGPFTKVAARYLIGSLFVNFKLLWEPTRKLIASHARGLGNKEFWELFHTELKRAAETTEKLLTGFETPYRHGNSALISLTDFDVSDIIPSHMTTERADYYNFRDQLWKAMLLFSDQCEAKSRDLSPLLLQFISNEYYPSDMSMAPTQNICRRSRKSDQEQSEGGDHNIEEHTDVGSEKEEITPETSAPPRRVTRSRSKSQSEEGSRLESSEHVSDQHKESDGKRTPEKSDKLKENEDESVEDSENQISKRQRRAATVTLIIHLELFAKFKNPKSLYQEPNLRNLYMELLVHKDLVVQKTTFDCIMAYKHNFLVPYRENFNRLLDDTTFKSELVLFSIDQEGGQINKEHRSQLLPILMRILYGKMLTKTGKETAGRSHSNLRQSIVLRFLNGCNMEEVVMFLDLVFLPFHHFITDNPQQMAIDVLKTTNLSEVIPLRKITGTLYSINTFCKKLGHLMDDYLPSIIEILVGLMATCIACLEQRDKITPFSLSILKTLRQMATNRFIEIFENYDGYKFSPVEIDAVFSVTVWPQVEKLPYEGVYHPTSLLKILATWSRSPRYILYLAKHHHDDKTMTPLPFVFKLLNAANIKSTVSSLILEIVDNLLNPKNPDDDTEELRPLPVHCGPALEYTHMTIQEIGADMMSPHIPALLTFLQTAIASRETKVYIKKGSSRELRILSSISCFVSDLSQCPILISLLLPFLDKATTRSKEAEEDILTSIINLMATITNKAQFFRRVSVLFSNLLFRKSRDLLCSILQMILTEENGQSPLADLIMELNAWDPKRTDEPDYMKRLGAFRNANDMIKSMNKIEVDMLLPIMHNACYFINMIDDLSIRDNATNTLVTMVKQFSLVTYDNDAYRDLISQGILVEIKAGFRNKNENVRHEYITLLSVVVDTFPDQPNFVDLLALKDKDLEADFFENIGHIQTHKRSRALRRLIKYMSGHQACKEAIMSYFLPLASAFLQVDSYTKAQALQEAAIDTIGAVCLQLPWQQYLHQLKFYLGRLQRDLDKQKGLIRVIVAILDSFHFDVSASQLNLTNLPESITKKKAVGLPTEEEDAGDDQMKGDENMIEDIDVTEVPEQDDSKQEMSNSQSGKMICPAALATKIHTTIVKGLLPQLQKCLTQKVSPQEGLLPQLQKYLTQKVSPQEGLLPQLQKYLTQKEKAPGRSRAAAIVTEMSPSEGKSPGGSAATVTEVSHSEAKFPGSAAIVTEVSHSEGKSPGRSAAIVTEVSPSEGKSPGRSAAIVTEVSPSEGKSPGRSAAIVTEVSHSDGIPRRVCCHSYRSVSLRSPQEGLLPQLQKYLTQKEKAPGRSRAAAIVTEMSPSEGKSPGGSAATVTEVSHSEAKFPGSAAIVTEVSHSEGKSPGRSAAIVTEVSPSEGKSPGRSAAIVTEVSPSEGKSPGRSAAIVTEVSHSDGIPRRVCCHSYRSISLRSPQEGLLPQLQKYLTQKEKAPGRSRAAAIVTEMSPSEGKSPGGSAATVTEVSHSEAKFPGSAAIVTEVSHSEGKSPGRSAAIVTEVSPSEGGSAATVTEVSHSEGKFPGSAAIVTEVSHSEGKFPGSAAIVTEVSHSEGKSPGRSTAIVTEVSPSEGKSPGRSAAIVTEVSPSEGKSPGRSAAIVTEVSHSDGGSAATVTEVSHSEGKFPGSAAIVTEVSHSEGKSPGRSAAIVTEVSHSDGKSPGRSAAIVTEVSHSEGKSPGRSAAIVTEVSHSEGKSPGRSAAIVTEVSHSEGKSPGRSAAIVTEVSHSEGKSPGRSAAIVTEVSHSEGKSPGRSAAIVTEVSHSEGKSPGRSAAIVTEVSHSEGKSPGRSAAIVTEVSHSEGKSPGRSAAIVTEVSHSDGKSPGRSAAIVTEVSHSEGKFPGSAAIVTEVSHSEGKSPGRSAAIVTEVSHSEGKSPGRSAAIVTEVSHSEGKSPGRSAAIVTEVSHSEGKSPGRSAAIVTEVSHSEGKSPGRSAAIVTEVSRSDGKSPGRSAAIVTEVSHSEVVPRKVCCHSYRSVTSEGKSPGRSAAIVTEVSHSDGKSPGRSAAIVTEVSHSEGKSPGRSAAIVTEVSPRGKSPGRSAATVKESPQSKSPGRCAAIVTEVSHSDVSCHYTHQTVSFPVYFSILTSKCVISCYFSILIKVCNFLKSRAKDIRDTARDTLTKILTSLGSRFLPYALSEMRGILTRGYQLHVLTFTVYVLLKNIMPLTTPGDLDVCCASLQEVFHNELFGEVGEEKDVEGIRAKLFEARKIKSYDSYQILAKLIGTKSLLPFIQPIKTVLDTTHSHKMARKVQEVLRRIVNGLMENENLTTEALTIFCHGLVSELFPQLSVKQSDENSKKNGSTPDDRRRKPQSCLLLPYTPVRGGEKPKGSKRTNAHILVEFGLQLLHLSLKKGRLVATKEEHLQMLDPFVSIMAKCLQSKHVKVNTVTMRCLCWILKFPLPALQQHIRPIANGIIVLLRNYASAGSAAGDNLDLITMAFKAVTVLVRDVTFYKINSEQLQVLLGFCEEDLHDYHRQSTAFSLLRAILSRKLNVPEMPELMLKVQTMSITANSPHTRRECRQISLQYMMDYPLGKKLIKHLEFFLTQLSYHIDIGRESALEMLATIFSSFPQTILIKHAGFFFVPLSVAMVNDESLKCRKLTGLAVKLLLEKLDHNSRNNLFSIALKWYKDEKLQHRSLGAQLCGLFVEVEAGQFERHLVEVLQVTKLHLQPSRYEKVIINPTVISFITVTQYSQCEDVHCPPKVVLHMHVTNIHKIQKQLDHPGEVCIEIVGYVSSTEYTQKHLTHPHNWVRLAAAQMFGLLFASWQPQEIVSEDDDEDNDDYLRDDMKNKMETLAVSFVQQLQSQFLSEEMAGQIIKNLIFISRVAKLATETEPEEMSDPEGSDFKGKRLSLPWLVRKMVREANHENINNSKVTIKRSSVFKWMAAVSLDLGAELLPSVAHIMIPPLQREIHDASGLADPAIKTLAQEVLDLLKKVLGVEQFTEVYANVQRKRMVIKETRKRQKAVEAVSNPEVAAKRKVKKNLAKRDAKKRKAEGFRVSKIVKKRKREDITVEG